MCSLNDADIDEVEECMEKEPSSIVLGPGTMCRKCHSKDADIILRVRDAYCRECFLASTVHKFRSSLGKSKIMKPKDRILVGYSGSQSSLALLHMLHEGENENIFKRILFTSLVLYIDEGAALGQTTEERQTYCASIAESVKDFGFPTYVTTLGKSLDDGSGKRALFTELGPCHQMDVDEDDDLKLQKILNATTSLTSRDDLVDKLRNKLLLAVAKQLDCCKIFLADCGTDVAIKILSNISLGRGAQLPLDVGFCDTRDPDVKILRPLRGFMNKEMTFYNIFHKIAGVTIPSIRTKNESDSSIQKLTEKFIEDLLDEFPSTVYTVCGTGDKLSLTSGTTAAEDSCVLCQGPLDTAHQESSAIQATEFSRMISKLGPAGFDSQSIRTLGSAKLPELPDENALPAPSSCCSEEAKTCACSSGGAKVNESGDVSWAEAEQFLCYGCRIIAREIETSVDQVPAVLVATIRDRAMYRKMREEIQDFLL